MRGRRFIRLFDFALVYLSGYLISQLVIWLVAETPSRDIRVDVFILGVTISILVLRIGSNLKRWLQRNLETTRERVWANRTFGSDLIGTAAEPLSWMESMETEETLLPRRLFAQVDSLKEVGGGGEGS
jgi:hypothetical protein